ncbi:hypothetical protein HFP72_04780 [Nocardiopsis sp. ARC36]
MGEKRWALTGSANLTGAALLRSTRAGGNCELGTIVPVDASLMPEATALPVSRLAGTSTIGRFERGQASGAPVPLGAVLRGKTLVVTLADAPSLDVVVEISQHGSPGSWEGVGTIRAGEVEGAFATWGGGGLVVRVRVPGGRTSAPVFAVDPRVCARPTADDPRPRMRRAHTEESLFDEEAEQEFQKDILQLAEELAAHGVTGSRATPAENRSATVEALVGDRWADYLQDCERTFGVPLTVSMFGHRAPAPAVDRDGSEAGEERWSLAGVEEGGEEAPAEAVQEVEESGDGLTERRRQRWRGWATRAVNACVPGDGAPVPPLAVRLLVARVVVRLLSRGVWTGPDDSWRPVLTRLVRGLIREDEGIPDQALEQACLVTAVCTGLLVEDVPLDAGTTVSREAQDTWHLVRERVALADPALGSGLLLAPEAPHARVLSPLGLERVIRLAGEDDPLVHVREDLERAGWTLEVGSGVHRVSGNFPNPALVAARVAESLEKHVGPVIVHARGSKGWALLLWSSPKMLLAAYPSVKSWRLYRVDRPATPSSRVGSEGVSPVGVIRTSAPLHRAPHPDVVAFLAAMGTDHITLLEEVGFLRAPS